MRTAKGTRAGRLQAVRLTEGFHCNIARLSLNDVVFAPVAPADTPYGVRETGVERAYEPRPAAASLGRPGA